MKERRVGGAGVSGRERVAEVIGERAEGRAGSLSFTRGRTSPRFPDVGVLGLVYHPWSEQWQTPHNVLTRLGRFFHVVWVNPPHGWRQIPALVRRQKCSVESVPGIASFHVYRGALWLPKFYRPDWLASFTFRQRMNRARRLLASMGCKRFVLYLWDFRQAPVRYQHVLQAETMKGPEKQRRRFEDVEPVETTAKLAHALGAVRDAREPTRRT